MSAKVDQFCGNMRDRLNTVEGRLTSLKTSIQAMPKQAEKAVREKLDEAHLNIRSEMEHFEKTRVNLEAHAREKLTETREAISEWKAKRETQVLNARADRSEANAADAIDNAAFAIKEAEEAILDAVVARHDADPAR